MINYVKKDEEFIGVIKLTTREEVICKCLVSDENEERSLILISDPVVAEAFKKQHEDQEVMGITFKKWMGFSDADFFVLKEEDIITIAPCSDEMGHYYAVFMAQENDEDLEEVKIENVKGYVGKVDDFRATLKKIFDGPSHFH